MTMTSDVTTPGRSTTASRHSGGQRTEREVALVCSTFVRRHGGYRRGAGEDGPDAPAVSYASRSRAWGWLPTYCRRPGDAALAVTEDEKKWYGKRRAEPQRTTVQCAHPGGFEALLALDLPPPSSWRSRRRSSTTGRSRTTRTSSSHAETMMSDRDAITEGLDVPGCLSNPGGWGGRAVRRSPRCSSFERTPRSRLWRPPRVSATAPAWSRQPGP
jgi:hypothetical protein